MRESFNPGVGMGPRNDFVVLSAIHRKDSPYPKFVWVATVLYVVEKLNLDNIASFDGISFHGRYLVMDCW